MWMNSIFAGKHGDNLFKVKPECQQSVHSDLYTVHPCTGGNYWEWNCDERIYFGEDWWQLLNVSLFIN